MGAETTLVEAFFFSVKPKDYWTEREGHCILAGIRNAEEHGICSCSVYVSAQSLAATMNSREKRFTVSVVNDNPSLQTGCASQSAWVCHNCLLATFVLQCGEMDKCLACLQPGVCCPVAPILTITGKRGCLAANRSDFLKLWEQSLNCNKPELSSHGKIQTPKHTTKVISLTRQTDLLKRETNPCVPPHRCNFFKWASCLYYKSGGMNIHIWV